MARQVHRVIGIEILAAAVVDAKRNAEANGIANAEFHAAPVEKVIDTVIAGIGPGRRVVAILDPPRSGVPDTVVRAVRACAAVTTLVYVACDAASASRNLLDLCRVESNRVHGAPFVITAACGQFLAPRVLGHISKGSPARYFFAPSDSTGRPVFMSTCVAQLILA